VVFPVDVTVFDKEYCHALPLPLIIQFFKRVKGMGFNKLNSEQKVQVSDTTQLNSSIKPGKK